MSSTNLEGTKLYVEGTRPSALQTIDVFRLQTLYWSAYDSSLAYIGPHYSLINRLPSISLEYIGLPLEIRAFVISPI